MVTFRTAETRPILGRGPSVLLRFIFYALLCFGLMWLDERKDWLGQVRYGISMVAYPVQALVNSPGAIWSWFDESFATRERLARENEDLRKRVRNADLRLMRFEALEQENLRLRGMREATANIAERVMVAEILRVDINPFRHRVIINKGAVDGVFKDQPILDASGVFGQITRAGLFTSEAILISDTEHAIPVQVNRNGIRSIAVGTGDLGKLSVPFLPTNADIKEGDLLVTSGLGGVFPSGYPVATVSKVKAEAAQTLAEITAVPAAKLDRDREVLLVWLKTRPAEPEPAPAPPAPKEEEKKPS